jgi:hypothetical protein
MRKVVAGNTLYDLGVGVGDVVYFDDAAYDHRGDPMTITRVIGNTDGTNTYYCDEHKLSGAGLWHVVSYSNAVSAMIHEPVAMAGVQGYSSPTPDAVVFSMNESMYEILCNSDAWCGLVAEHLSIGEGCYEGKQEQAFSLPKSVFDEMNRRWPWILHDQHSVLILGTPGSQNWRPARLLFLQASGWPGGEEDLGTWHEVTRAQAVYNGSWSHFNGHWFICEHEPAEDAETVKERLIEEKLKLLDSVMSRICAMTKPDMHKYGLYHDWATWATMDKRGYGNDTYAAPS